MRRPDQVQGKAWGWQHDDDLQRDRSNLAFSQLSQSLSVDFPDES